MGRLTTHVLDTSRGRPAAGLRIELFAVGDSERRLRDMATNQDGRTSTPLVEGDEFVAGVYELRFHAGDYLRMFIGDAPPLLFLDVIPIRFGISDASQHFHVPLLLSPIGYSTYRGS